jgi:uncharacterized protein (TIGR03067 family)
MKARLVIALLAVLGATAFAPAPFPKTERRGGGDEISLRSLQGNWKAVRFDEIIGKNNERKEGGMWFGGVRIRGDRWSYLVNGDEEHPYQLVISDSRPATIDFFNVGAKPDHPVMIGLVRREGSRVTILYYRAGELRPRSFEHLPVNWWLLALEKDG